MITPLGPTNTRTFLELHTAKRVLCSRTHPETAILSDRPVPGECTYNICKDVCKGDTHNRANNPEDGDFLHHCWWLLFQVPGEA